MRSARGEASPSLALVKYWGKQAGETNIPATTSIAVGLDSLRTVTHVREARRQEESSVSRGASGGADGAGISLAINGEPQDTSHFAPVAGHFRRRARAIGHTHADSPLHVASENSFPTAAGIASSSSGFAALVLALNAFFELDLDPVELSSLAREGSGSAARSVYEGFTRFDAGARAATPLYSGTHWPELRVLVAVTNTGKKDTGSRNGMERTRHTSPYFGSWVHSSFAHAEAAHRAVADCDLQRLGPIMRESYLRMTGSMLAASPPVLYWLPESVALIRLCEQLRNDGIPVWETMDAGPQLKMVTTVSHLARVRDAVIDSGATRTVLESSIGGTPVSVLEEE